MFESATVTALEEAAKAYVAALSAERELRSGELVPDHPTRISAADKITDRVMGRPLQRSETHLEASVEVDVKAKLLALLARSDTPG